MDYVQVTFGSLIMLTKFFAQKKNNIYIYMGKIFTDKAL